MKYCICVTGGTGFIASHLIKSLLAKGHIVRTTVRNPDDKSKVQFLRDMDGAEDRLKLFKADLMEEGSFDEAIDGVDVVFHTASPVIAYDQQDIQGTLIDPAIKGTANVLTSCSRATSVKRVILTSSASAVRYRDGATLASPLSESHWSDPNYCKRYKLWYGYAKTLAEKEAWGLAKDLKIDLVAINPSFVVGPLLSPNPTSSLALILNVLKGTAPTYPNLTIGFVHVDDVVKCHILAMEEKRVSGRLNCSGPVAHWSEIVRMFKSKYPNYPITDRCGNQEGDRNPHSMDTSKLSGLGFTLAFNSIEKMFDDCIASFKEKGLLKNI